MAFKDSYILIKLCLIVYFKKKKYTSSTKTLNKPWIFFLTITIRYYDQYSFDFFSNFYHVKRCNIRYYPFALYSSEHC